jgi:anti-sigma regulatory factor (Ser/Thr protein kinase)
MGEWKHINHLIGANSPFIENEKKYCLQNMTINHIFGLERHLGAFDVMVHLKIQLGLDFNLQLMQALDKISYEDYFEGPRSYLELISNELIINALKHSPSGVIDYFLATSENGLGISVRDEGGVLTRDTILEKIDRGFREQTPEERKNGAGLGLYLAYNIANQIIFATVPSVATEVTVIIEPNKRYKKYKERITSIHFYEVNA